MKRVMAGLTCCLLAIATVSGFGTVARADITEAGAYGSGDYGSCGYGSCSITLTSGGSVDVDVTPTAGGRCSVQSDTVTVETGNSAGYTVTMAVDAADNHMTASSGTIPAHSAAAASPSSLGMNTWGYRVDGTAGFGGGPTSAQANGAVPGVPFAGVPDNTGAMTPVTASSEPTDPTDETTVWYGVCADMTQASGSYEVTVLYTAVAN